VRNAAELIAADRNATAADFVGQEAGNAVDDARSMSAGLAGAAAGKPARLFGADRRKAGR